MFFGGMFESYTVYRNMYPDAFGAYPAEHKD
jgi:hypothetical protein